ncbi:MAG: glycine/betaine ABC transporter substrate-binding protein [Spirochaetia bacterium]|jgi:osmoprotectant transport system substrate-binding protein|nr:glycine/betaine ABC transporter substrate-binding protein [Spirochaetia bacterium]
MNRKVLVGFLLILISVLVFAGGKKETVTPAAAPEETGVATAEAKGTGVPFKAPISIGTKNFTEQFIVGNLMAILLEDRGYDIELKTGMASTVLREAMENGSLDLSMDYTGTQWLSYTGHAFKGESPAEMYKAAKESDAEKGLVWLAPIWCNNTYAIAITSEFSKANKVTNLSQFAEYVKGKEGKVELASDFEFYSRPDGILGLQVHYGFAFNPDYVTTVLPGLTFEYLASGKSVATMVFGTDSAVVKNNWIVLQDDKNFWPPYDLAPYLSQEALDANPGLADVLGELITAFPDEPAAARSAMTALNAKVDIDLMEPEDAAREWLQAKGLIK